MNVFRFDHVVFCEMVEKKNNQKQHGSIGFMSIMLASICVCQ